MDQGIRIRPRHDPDGTLVGFTMSGRHPDSTAEWTAALIAMLHQIATEPALPASTVFHACETLRTPQQPDNGIAQINTLGTVPAELDACRNALQSPDCPTPLALLVLHPPGLVPLPELEEPGSRPTASGALLLPGIPDVGLDHRAAWAAVDTAGSIQRLAFSTHASLNETVDVAVLGALIDPFPRPNPAF